jgi:hypothetical protein
MVKAKEYKFQVHVEADARMRSAIMLVKLLLRKDVEISYAHRQEFLSLALWKVTEAESTHKHRTRFCSQAAYTSPESNLRHDHVFQRAPMVRALLDSSPENVDEILDNAVACTITKDEHTLLNKFRNLDGWERYRMAEIDVIDTKIDKPVESTKSASIRENNGTEK